MERPGTAPATALFFFWLTKATHGAIYSDTLQCKPQIFVPFTFNGVTRTMISRGPQSTGFSHMAAAWLAMEHFNRRDTSIVPELGDEIFQNCKVTFEMGADNETNSTGRRGTHLKIVKLRHTSAGHQGSQLLYQSSQGLEELPCAFVGPYQDGPTIHIATMAASLGVPHIPSGGQDARLSEALLNPFTSVLYPRITDMTSALGRFLSVHKRTNYIATLFAFTESGNQFQEGIGIVLDALNVTQRKNFGYLSPTIPVPIQGQSIRDGLQRIKEIGYRTVVVIMDNDVFDLTTIADAAEEFGMNTAEYLWIFLPPYQHESVQALIDLPDSLRNLIKPPVPPYDNVRKLLTGAALLQPVDGFQVSPKDDKLAQAWRSVDESFVERLTTQATVVTPNGAYAAGDYEKTRIEYFQTYAPEPGSSYLFDAVIAVGMGSCIAEQQPQRNGLKWEAMTGTQQLAGIRKVNFAGASGRVEFGVSVGLLGNVTSARLPSHMSIGVFNLFPPASAELDGPEGAEKSYTLTATYTDLINREEIALMQNGASIADFVRVDDYNPFLFKDGTTTAPILLRDPADQNYLSPGLRYLGISMMGLSLACCLAFGVWVFVHRKRRIVKASQPEFLYLLIFGSALTSSSIFGISTDEGWGFTADQLGRQCMFIVWLASLGHIVTYGALFTKLWRVNKVLQFSRRQINVSSVVWPYSLLMLASVTVLAVWTAVDPLKWVRVELDEVTGESIGQCDCDSMGYFIIALATVMLIPSLLTFLMAWKTRDVDDCYAEHKWIFSLVVIQLQVIIIAIPLIIVLRDVSTDGKYIGLLAILWVLPITTLLLIMLPKIVAHHNGMHGLNFSERTRGSSVGVRVTGMHSVPESATLAYKSGESRLTSDERSRPSTETQKTPLVDEPQSEADEFAEESGRTNNERSRPSPEAHKTPLLDKPRSGNDESSED